LSTWFLTSLFHDCGYFVSNKNSLYGDISKLKYNIFDSKTCIQNIFNETNFYGNKDSGLFQQYNPVTYKDYYHKLCENKEVSKKNDIEFYDHGILGGAIFFNNALKKCIASLSM
jgi:hypothetical protein